MEKTSKKHYSDEEYSEYSSSLLSDYYKFLGKLSIDTHERGTRLQHAKWMCLRAQSFEDRDKTNKWLGYIQCTLEYEGLFSKDDLREHATSGKINKD